MKNPIFRLYAKFDRLQEPLRFFAFIIPASILVMAGHIALALERPQIALFVMLFLCVVGLTRMSYLKHAQSEKSSKAYARMTRMYLNQLDQAQSEKANSGK